MRRYEVKKSSLSTSTDQAVLASISVSSFNDAEASGLTTNASFKFVADMSFDSASPPLDIADPQQLLEMLSCSGLSEEEEEEEEVNISDTDDLTVLIIIGALFLPPITTGRPVGQSKREICTNHKLLTGADVVLQKRLKLEKKLCNSAKSKPKKLKS
ncbi:hypothetical protein DPMN_106367 [Dreissena polymorpha]|uniref:Uncharacterized protein n=1 Tax=Dreissena polymorpha TaxID=45954 RepID=A0A9D4K504_DREPO|nr:hypothetical protein DPMN_106367 [Dreissena polymorpha]